MQSFFEMLMQQGGGGGGDDRPLVTEEQITEAARIFDVQHTFTRGQAVTWKPGMKDKRFPAYGEAAVAMGFLEGVDGGALPRSVFPPGSPYRDPATAMFTDNLDILIGAFADGTFCMWWLDSRRFQPFDVNAARQMRKEKA